MPNYKSYQAPTLKEAKALALKEMGLGITYIGERNFQKKVWRRYKFVKENWVELRVAVYAHSKSGNSANVASSNVRSGVMPYEENEKTSRINSKPVYSLAANFSQHVGNSKAMSEGGSATSTALPLEDLKKNISVNAHTQKGKTFPYAAFSSSSSANNSKNVSVSSKGIDLLDKGNELANTRNNSRNKTLTSMVVAPPNYSSLLQRKHAELLLVEKENQRGLGINRGLKQIKSSFPRNMKEFRNPTGFTSPSQRAEVKAQRNLMGKSRDFSKGFTTYTPRKRIEKEIINNSTVASFLLRRGISEKLAKVVVKESLVKDANSQTNVMHIASTLAECVTYSSLFLGERSKKKTRFIFFAGPVGVGKTSAIFKLASLQKQNGALSLGVASFDCKRLMAPMQLQHFCKIITVPYRRLQSQDDLLRMEKEAPAGSTVLVDLSGMVASNTNATEEMAALKGCLSCETHLLYFLDATKQYADMVWNLKMAMPLGISSIALCKTDETLCIGNAISAVWQSGFPLSSCFFGTDIPHDYSPASKAWVESSLLKKWE